MVTEGFLAGPSYVYPPYYSANLIPEPICQEAYLRVGRKEVRRVVGGLFVPGLLVGQQEVGLGLGGLVGQ